MTVKKKKYRLNWKHIIPTLLVFIAIIAALVVITVSLSHRHRNTVTNTTPTETVNVNSFNNGDEYISINMGNCTMYVGTTAKITCSSEPEQYADAVIWSSSNPDVVSIDANGQLSVLTTGTSAITAAYGTLTDSVVVNAVVEGSDEENSTEYPTVSITNGEVVIPTIDVTAPTKLPQNETVPDETTTAATYIPAETTAHNSPPETTASQNNDKPQAKDTVIAEINGLGFTTYSQTSGTDVYTYYEDGNYLGEVIVTDSQMQIFVKTRTSTFDSSVKNLLKLVMPTAYENVYSNFISAVKDQTLNGDGHRVRIIAPAKGSHAQLIVEY